MDDANELIDIARESGFIDEQIKRYAPNATKCLTRSAAQESHFGKDKKVVFKLENIYGMIILLGAGLVLSMLIAMLELIVYKVKRNK